MTTTTDPTAKQSDEALSYRRRPPSVRPALVVVCIAAGLLLLFGVGAAISGPSTSSSGTRHAAVGPVPGTSLVAVSASPALRAIDSSGQPPSNIVRSVTLPRGYTVVGSADNSARYGLYDEQMEFRVPTTESELITYFRHEMPRLGWQISSAGPAQHQPGFEVLGKKAGDDGWYWQMGATVSPTTFQGATNVTSFTIELYQVSDTD